MNTSLKYAACEHINRKQPEVSTEPEVIASLAKNYKVIPLYEKGIADHEFTKTHSLHSNQFLYCRWLEYKRLHLTGKPDPFDFPHVNDFHFKNYNVVYNPALSIIPEGDHRLKLRPGPGVDDYGDKPIPSDIDFRGMSKQKIAQRAIMKKKLLKRSR